MLNHPDFNRLKVFYYIFATRSIAKASEELNVTQSAVSQQLKKLEEEVETQLFTRLHKRLIPTPEAQKLFSILEPFFHDLETGLRSIKQGKDKPSGELRVGSPHGFGKAYLPKIFATFRRRFPEVTFRLWLGDANRIFAMLDKGQLDIALIDEYLIQRMHPDDLKNYTFEKVVDEKLILAGSKEYCDERVRGDYSLENLLQQDFISCHLDALALTNWFSYHFGIIPARLNVVLETDSFQTVMEGIEKHLGLSITASHLVAEQLKDGKILAVPAPGNDTINRISAVQFRAKEASLTEKIFLAHFHQEIKCIGC